MTSLAEIRTVFGQRIAAFAVLLAVAGLLGCSQKTESQEDESQEGYPIIGEVIEVRLDEGTIKASHEDIPGFMPAMTMDFKVGPAEIQSLAPGFRFRARLVRDAEGAFVLVKIWPFDEAAEKRIKASNKALEKQLKKLPTGRYLGEDDHAPRFSLMDQDGTVFSSEAFDGRPFVINFIFTRCTDAKMCPLSTSKMATLQKMAAEKGFADLGFISITLDPEFDTPGVLKRYGEMYGIDGSNFKFVTGPKSSVSKLLQALGVMAYDREDTIMHSLATTLVGRDGTILMRSEKSDWSPAAFLAKAME